MVYCEKLTVLNLGSGGNEIRKDCKLVMNVGGHVEVMK